MVIAKLVTRRDALALLRNKKKLLELSPDGKRKLQTNKVSVKKSLCPSYKHILGLGVVNYEEDLLEVFGQEIVD